MWNANLLLQQRGIILQELNFTATNNFIITHHIFTTRVLDELHELQQMQFIICGTVYVCNSCNLVAIMKEKILCNFNATNL
jgi:hypothetical protein